MSEVFPNPRIKNPANETHIQKKIDQKTKPPGALGHLEPLAKQVVGVLGETPEVIKPTMIVFAGDHGAVSAGISAYPQEVTGQMVQNFLAGGAAINVFARQQNMALMIVDAGVKGDLGVHPQLRNCKIGKGTANFLDEPAMTRVQMMKAIEAGRKIVVELEQQGVNTLGLGEMGIGNTSSAALIMSAIADLPLTHCIGRGTGLDDAGLAQKTALLTKAQQRHGRPEDPLQTLASYGGFEMAMMAGAYAEAAHRGMLILVDGFIATAALLPVWAQKPNVLGSCVFSHCSAEKGHQMLLDHLKVRPLLQLDLRLGEGTGAALALPLVQAAINFYNEMASFDDAGVSGPND